MVPQVRAYYRLSVSLREETASASNSSDVRTPRSMSMRQRSIYARAKGVSQGLFHLNTVSCLCFVVYAIIPVIQDESILLLPVLVTNLVALGVGIATFVYQQRIMHYVKEWERVHLADPDAMTFVEQVTEEAVMWNALESPSTGLSDQHTSELPFEVGGEDKETSVSSHAVPGVIPQVQSTKNEDGEHATV